jgi:hypothetical protein
LLKLEWLQRKESEEPEKESKERGRPRPESCSIRESITMGWDFPNRKMVLLTHSLEGQEATMLQRPAQSVTATEIKAQERVPHVG